VLAPLLDDLAAVCERYELFVVAKFHLPHARKMIHNLLTLIWWLWAQLGTRASVQFVCYAAESSGDGERGRNRTFNLLIKSTCGTRNQHFSAVWMHSHSLVKMRVLALRPNLQLNVSKRPLGTILGTAVATKEQVVRPEWGGGV
jgi:hypothetical protein